MGASCERKPAERPSKAEPTCSICCGVGMSVHSTADPSTGQERKYRPLKRALQEGNGYASWAKLPPGTVHKAPGLIPPDRQLLRAMHPAITAYNGTSRLLALVRKRCAACKEHARSQHCALRHREGHGCRSEAAGSGGGAGKGSFDF